MSTISYIYGGLSANTISAVTISTGSLKISSPGTGTSIAILALDNSGNVVSGATAVADPSYWTSGSSGSFSIKADNDSGLDATGNYAVAQGNATSAAGQSSHAGGYNSTASGNTSFIHSTNSLVTGDRSVVLGGQNITGTTADTVYVPNLNVQSVGSGTSLFNLGIDSSGNIVTGTTDYVSKYAVDFTFTANTASTINHNLNTSDVIVQMKDSTGAMIIPDAINNYQINSVDILVTVSDTYRVIIIGNDYGATVTNDTLFAASDLGFVITPKPAAVINQNVVLPPNCDVTYPSPLVMGSWYTITTPPSTTLTII